MRKRLLSALTLLTFALALSAQQVYNGTKMSGYLQKLAQKETNARARGTQPPQQKVCVLMRFNELSSAEAIGKAYDCQILDSIGGIYFVNIPTCQLGPLSLDNRVLRIEAHEMPRPTMNEVPEYVGAVSAWSGEGLPQAFTGKGVMAGVVDIGFDFTHPMFCDSIGKTRISRFYDMSRYDESGNLGIVYQADDLTALHYSPRAVNQTHGTHVASLMAGSCVNGRKAAYSGIAPQSNIGLAEVATGTVDSTDNQRGSSVSMLLGIKRLFDYADELGQPCVVNLSMGAWLPITESTELMDEAFGSLIGPGHILVASAGNEGGLPTTMTKRDAVKEVRAGFYGTWLSGDTISTQSKATSIECDLLTEYPQEVKFHFGVWGNHIFGTTVSIKTDSIDSLPNDTCLICRKIFDNDSDEDLLMVNVYRIKNQPLCVQGNLYHFSVNVISNEYTFSNWVGTMNVEAEITSDYPCQMFTNPIYTPFVLADAARGTDIPEKYYCLDYSHTIGWPAAMEQAIGVGSLSLNVSHGWGDNRYVVDAERNSTSSCGPTWDNHIKPDVMAPGNNILGAYNQFSYTFEKDKNGFYDTIKDNGGNEHYIVAMSGTSMASPIVAGAIAMWLQANPNLTPAEIKEILAQTCKHPDGAGDSPFPNNEYGFGEIDVYAGLLHILGISGIEGLSAQQPIGVRVKLDGRTLSVVDNATGLPVDADVTLVVYSLDGKVAASANALTLDLSSLRSGVYAVQVNSNEEKAKGSTLIRL